MAANHQELPNPPIELEVCESGVKDPLLAQEQAEHTYFVEVVEVCGELATPVEENEF
jgi:hypothetical protein